MTSSSQRQLLPLEKIDVLLHKTITELFDLIKSGVGGGDKWNEAICLDLMKHLLVESQKNPHVISRLFFSFFGTKI
jgi:hypothetical protein